MVFAFVYGLLFGSFFNVLIYRLPRGESVVFPASSCPACGHKLSWYENLPLLSFIALGGKCRACKGKISLQYPLIELATGIYSLVLIFILSSKIQWAVSGYWWNWAEVFLQYFTLLLFLPIAIIDVKHYIIPDELTITGAIIAFAVSFLPGGITPLQSIVGLSLGGGFLLLAGILGKIILKKENTMGGGDVKLLFWIGALFGVETAFAAIFLGSTVGTVASVALILRKKITETKIKEETDEESENENLIPFGPYLCAGALIFAIFEKEIMAFF